MSPKILALPYALAAVFVSAVSPAPAQLPGSTGEAEEFIPPKTTDEVVSSGLVELPNAEMSDIAIEYQQRTGTHAIIDAGVAGVVLNVVSNPDLRMTNEEAIEFIETTLLFNNVAIVPVKDGIVKFLATGTKAPAQEGIEIFSAPLDPLVAEGENLPDNEEVINYVMRLTHVGPEEAAEVFTSIVPPHPYGLYQPVPEAGVLIITENVPTVRQLIAMKQVIDVDPGKFTQKVVPLDRADAESVAGIITEIITARTQQRSGGQAAQGGGNRARANTAVPAADGASALAAALQGNTGGGQNATQGAVVGNTNSGGRSGIPDESSIILQAIPRLNSILVFARPIDIIWVEGLIADLDAEAQFKKFRTYQLRFIPVTDFIGVAIDTISRGVDEALVGGGSTGVGGSARTTGGTTARNNNRTNSTANRAGNSFGGGNTTGTNAFGGGGGSFGAGGGSNFGGGTSGGGAVTTEPPVSQIIGKTLLIADPTSNSLIVSGPPDQLATIDELILTIDKRPRQVYISAIIAQITLGDDIQTGFDLIRKVDSFDVNGTKVNAAGLVNGITRGVIDPAVDLRPPLQEILSDTNGNPILDANSQPQFIDVVNEVGETIRNPDSPDLSPFFGPLIPAASGVNAYLSGGFYAAYINALETTNQFRVLARPSVFTANNNPALIESGQQIPVPSSTQSTVVGGGTQSLNSTITYRDILLSLSVTPLINSDDEVTLIVEQGNNNISGFSLIDGNQIPNIITQNLSTTVSVPNGGVAVLGGLIQEQKSETASGIPFIARIPILNIFAGNKASSLSRNELMVFIQAKIVDSTTDLVDLNIDEARRNVVSKPALTFANPPRDPDEVLSSTIDPYTGAEVYPQELPKRERWNLGDGIKRFFRAFKPVSER